ncbi:MAG TPA: integrase arm-type DNA-binding domain-containing protein [Caulobacteraceae bacterium]|jgi:integrase|nr:integrase arm-type DNA-binding domain-containing protein [Caulobacteraceae bacterium]
MARTKERLEPVEVTRLAGAKNDKTRMHHDGGGLYLIVDKRGGASWVFRYMIDGKARSAGLGPYPTVRLGAARRKADTMRRLLKEDRVDPLQAREAERTAKRLEAARAMTFRQCAEAYIASNNAAWRNEKHGKQWAATLEAYVYPLVGKAAVGAIDVTMVMEVLEQLVGDPPARLWTARPETAGRVRGRMEAVFGWAEARGLRSGDNPAAWKGRLEHQLPSHAKIKKVTHHAALDHAETGAFLRVLRTQPGMAARALEFAILTAARTGEALGSVWGEINLADKVWLIPAERMKGKKAHRVPLSDVAVAILTSLKPADAEPGDFVFPGAKPGRPLSNMAFLMLLRRMSRDDLTAHGFRSTFRDWAFEVSGFPGELAEAALAHVAGNAVVQAYQRGDALDRRRLMMTAWAEYCSVIAAANDGGEELLEAVGG